MAIFSAALPVGAAVGYILGGALGDSIGWRSAFILVGAPGLILAGLILMLNDPRAEKKKIETQEKKEDAPNLKAILDMFLKNGNYRNVVLGYCAYTFVVGGLAHWMPTYLERYYRVEMGDLPSGVVFGGIAAASGFIGTMLGGSLADRWDQKTGNGYEKLSALSMWLSIPSFVFFHNL